MILGIRAHSVRFQLTVQIDKGSTDFCVFTKRCAHHPRDAIVLQKCTNCELIFEFECPRKKKDYVHALKMKNIMCLIEYTCTKEPHVLQILYNK